MMLQYTKYISLYQITTPTLVQCAIGFCRQFASKQLFDMDVLPERVVHSSLSSVLDVFHDAKYSTDPNVVQLLKIYTDTANRVKQVPRNHPLVVLEGLDLSGKTTLSRLLSKRINAVNLKSPPASISGELRAAFDDNADLKTAFYSLGNYIAANDIIHILEKQPVVLDRFWHSTSANSLARAIQVNPRDCALPARGHRVYKWPTDLIQPDIVMFLSVSEQERQKRQERRKDVTRAEMMLKENHSFRQNVLLAYQYMEEPAIQMVSSDESVRETLDNILKIVKHIIPVKSTELLA